MKYIFFFTLLFMFTFSAAAQMSDKDTRKMAHEFCKCAEELSPDSSYTREQFITLCTKYALNNLEGEIKFTFRTDDDIDKFSKRFMTIVVEDCEALWKHWGKDTMAGMLAPAIKDSSACTAFHTGTFRYDTEHDSTTLVVKKDGYQLETIHGTKYFIKMKVEWKSECEYWLTVIDYNLGMKYYKKGDIIKAKVVAIKGNRYFVESDYKGRISQMAFLKLD